MGPNGQSNTYTQAPAQPPATHSSMGKIIIVIVGALVIAGGSFYAGIAYEKNHVSPTGTGGYGEGGGFGGHMMGAFGTVSAISSSSITVKDSRTGSSSTYSIGSSTTVTDNGSSSSVSAIADGDTVIVRTSSSGSTAASEIMVNPSFGGGPGGGQASGTMQP